MKRIKEKIRVVVVDDSPTARDLLIALYQADGDMEVVGVGSNGEEAIQLTQRLRPDVVSMDVVMPKMDGLQATRLIMRDVPTPIVIVTASLMPADIDMTFEALQAGALAAVKKPGLNDPVTCEQVTSTIRLMAGVHVVTRWSRAGRKASSDLRIPTPLLIPNLNKRVFRVVGIAASTGGPSTLATVLGGLPANFPLPILIVQHVTNGFALGLAEWLNSQIAPQVSLAGHGDLPKPGTVLMPPDDYHLQLGRSGAIELSRAAPYKGLRPSANFLFNSMAAVYGSRSVGVILTGMGDDGAVGMENLHKAGSLTVAQEEQSCVVFGMPHEAILRNAVDIILEPEKIGQLLNQLVAIQEAS
jgi:two-component system, chemotaxis family, protein-glutamate methylesterase/glutaminase